MRVIRFEDENGVERYGEEAAVGSQTKLYEGNLFASSRPLVFAGPSGAGKGTLIDKLMKKYPGAFGFSVSHTTRGPRPGEVNGVHYHFTTRDVMQREIDDGAFIEHADVHGRFYGTSRKSVQDVASEGRVCILDIDIQGVKSVRASSLDPLYVFVEPPSLTVLEQRLRGRGTEDEAAIKKRMGNAAGEMAYGDKSKGNFDLNLVNDDLDGAFLRLENWLRSQYAELTNYPLPANGLRPSSTGETATVRKLLAPIAPTNVFCIGLNYKEHAAEGARKKGVPLVLPERPVIFMKPTSTVTNPGEAIQVPSLEHGEETDFEVELAVVIGRPARNVAKADALSYVAGYTVANDVSGRYWQRNAGGGQWIKGKAFDTYLPLGPVLLADASVDPQSLQVRSILNGQTMQDKSTGDMIFTVPEIIAWLSKDTTLLPGTVILTGTPEGVGYARDPAVFLKDGDTIDCEISRIGKLSNPVVGPTPSPSQKGGGGVDDEGADGNTMRFAVGAAFSLMILARRMKLL